MSDVTWHPKRVTHGKSYVVHLNVWLTISHMIDDAIKGNKKIKKKKKKNKIIIIIIKKKHIKVKKGRRWTGEREGVQRRFLFFIFSYLRFFLRSSKIGP